MNFDGFHALQPLPEVISDLTKLIRPLGNIDFVFALIRPRWPAAPVPRTWNAAAKLVLYVLKCDPSAVLLLPDSGVQSAVVQLLNLDVVISAPAAPVPSTAVPPSLAPSAAPIAGPAHLPASDHTDSDDLLDSSSDSDSEMQFRRRPPPLRRPLTPGSQASRDPRRGCEAVARDQRSSPRHATTGTNMLSLTPEDLDRLVRSAVSSAVSSLLPSVHPQPARDPLTAAPQRDHLKRPECLPDAVSSPDSFRIFIDLVASVISSSSPEGRIFAPVLDAQLCGWFRAKGDLSPDSLPAHARRIAVSYLLASECIAVESRKDRKFFVPRSLLAEHILSALPMDPVASLAYFDQKDVISSAVLTARAASSGRERSGADRKRPVSEISLLKKEIASLKRAKASGDQTSTTEAGANPKTKKGTAG